MSSAQRWIALPSGLAGIAPGAAERGTAFAAAHGGGTEEIAGAWLAALIVGAVAAAIGIGIALIAGARASARVRADLDDLEAALDREGGPDA